MLKTKLRVFIFIVALLFPLVVHAEARTVSSNGVIITGSYEAKILELVNEARVNAGLSELSLDYNLTLAARQRAAELGVFYDGGHRRSDLRGARSVLDDYHIAYQYAGENIAYGYGISQYTTPEGVVNVWLNSPAHRDNILNSNYSALGIGIFKGPNNRYYWVQEFTNNVNSTYQPGAYQESSSHTRVRYEEYNSNFQYNAPSNLELTVGDTYNLQYQISTSNAGSDEAILLTLYDWSSTDPGVVSIEDNGSIILHANKAGTATIQTTFQDQTISFQVQVSGSTTSVNWLQVINSNNQVRNISLANVTDYSTYVYDAEDTLYNGVTQFYSNGEVINPSSYQVALCEDEACSNPIYPIRYQSLDESICKYVDGAFIFQNSGQTTITAIFENGIQVRIPVSVSLLKFQQSEYQVSVEHTFQTSITTDLNEYSFVSGNSNIVTISDTGLLTGISENTTEIYVIGEHQIFSKAKVTVLPMPQININVGQYDVVLVEDQTLDLTIQTDPNHANLSYLSDNSSIASVSQDGVIRGVHEGETTIHVTASLEHYLDNSLEIKVSVTPKKIPVESIQVDNANLRLEVGCNTTIQASVRPSNATDSTLRFNSRNPNIATVDSNGKVLGVSPGNTVIEIQAADGISTTIPIEIVKKSIETTKLEVNQSLWRLDVGDTASLIIEVAPEQDLVVYSDYPQIATIGADYTITAVSEGMTTIHIVTEDQKEAQVVVYVKQPIPIDDLIISDNTIALLEGDTYQIQANVSPNNTTLSKEISWTSMDSSIASVNSSGVISAHAVGDTTILVTTSNGIEKRVKVYVTASVIPISSINVSRDSLSLKVGESSSLEVTFDPVNTTESRKLLWSSNDTDIASVDDNGVIIAHSEGDAIITITASNGSSIFVNVHVDPIESEYLTLSSHEITVTDFSSTLTIDANFDLDENEMEWIVDDPSILIFQDNQIIPLQYGETSIIFRYQEFVDICHVVVSREFSNTTLGQFKNSNLNLENHAIVYVLANTRSTYQVSLEDNLKDYLGDSIIWSSSNPDVLEVDTNGKVFFKKAGYGLLTASVGMYSSDLYFHVYGMNITSDSNAIYVGDTTRIHVDVTTPNLIHSASGHYSIRGQHLATISTDGVLTGTHPGSVEVVVYSEDNRVYKTITVQILNNPPNHFNVVLDQNTFTISNRNGTAVIEINQIKEQIESALSLSSNEEIISAYDISFISGNNSTFQDPIYHIIIPITIDRNLYESIYVAYIVDGTIMEIINVQWNDDSIEFDVTHFSQYAIIGLLKSKSDSSSEGNNSNLTNNDSKTIKKQNESNNPQTGNNILIYIVIWIVAFLLLNRFTTLLFHKKKND